MALTLHHHSHRHSHRHPLEHHESTWLLHIASVASLLVAGAFWWTALSDPFLGLAGWCGPVAGVSFVALAALAVVRPRLAHVIVWSLAVALPVAAFVAEPFGWAYVALLAAVCSVPCAVCGALLHSTMRRLAADSLARRA